MVEVGVVERDGFVDAQPRSLQDDDEAAESAPVGSSPAVRMTAAISSTGGGWAG
jgi:hypothetical protein